MPRPNLFQFATGELSQDAFICWSLAWGQQSEDEVMQQYGLSLLNAMLETHQYNVQDLERITIIDVKNQVSSIDVLVKFKLDEQEFELIIEDKTNTMMHSNQIKRYFDQRMKQSPDKVILGIYYKTCFIFDDEEINLEELRKNNYPVKSFDKEKILQSMSQYLNTTDSDVFHDYYDYIKRMLKHEKEILYNVHSSHIRVLEKSLSTQMGQVEVMKSIFGNVDVSRGRSYGKPWVHYAFKKGNYKDSLPDRLFYRIDKKKNGYYISLRQYRDLKKEAKRNGQANSLVELKIEKLARLNKLIKIFEEVMDEIKLEYLEEYIERGKRTTDRKGYNESEVGVFYFTGQNRVAEFTTFFKIFHLLFCAKMDMSFNSKTQVSSESH